MPEKGLKRGKNTPENIWKFARKALIFAPASTRKQIWNRSETGSEKVWKKFRNLLEFQKKDLPLQPLSDRETGPETAKKGSEKVLKKSSKRFGSSEKRIYLCTRFEIETRFKANEKGSEKFLKKDLVVRKIWLNFAPLSHWKISGGTKAKIEGSDPTKRKKLFL